MILPTPLPGGSEVKMSAWNAGDLGLIPGSGRSPGEWKWQPTPVLLPGESHGGRSLVGYSPWGCKESDTTELPHYGKGRGSRDQIANIRWIMEKAREFQRNIYFCFIDYAKAFDYVDHNKLWKILKEMGIPEHLTCLLRNLYAGQEAAVRTGHGTTDWFQIWKGVHQGYCHPAYLTYMQSTSCEMLGSMKHKLESRLPGEISIIWDRQMIPYLWQKGKRN